MVLGEIKNFFFVDEEKFDQIIFFVVKESKKTILNFKFGFLA